jgi:hypothetical protein
LFSSFSDKRNFGAPKIIIIEDKTSQGFVSILDHEESIEPILQRIGEEQDSHEYKVDESH